MISINLERLIKELDHKRTKSIYNGNFERYTKDYLINKKIRHIYNSNRIEGSTVTYSDTVKLLRNIVDLEKEYSLLERLEVEGLDRAFKLFAYYIDSKLKITVDRIKKLHSHIYVYDEFGKGEYRNHSSTSDKYKDREIYTHPTYIEEDMEDIIKNFYKNNNYYEIEKIVNLKLDFICTHPFSDGNGRLSRLLLNWAFIEYGYIPINIMAENREEYIEVLDKCRIENTNKYFLHYLINLLLNEYNKI